jgi:XTP/dITP diphosphohydrolase
VKSAADLDLPEPEETEDTFEGNAILKARSAADLSGLPALADDSGLAVDALGGEPGIYSARWAGEPRDFSKAMEKVEERLRAANATRPEDRRARFVSALALAMPGGDVETFVGVVEGTLVWPPRGDRGFGYDPIFLPDGQEQTFGEMSVAEKHGWETGEGLSHRARAFKLFASRYLGKSP